jgi:hypothetical protein
VAPTVAAPVFALTHRVPLFFCTVSVTLLPARLAGVTVPIAVTLLPSLMAPLLRPLSLSVIVGAAVTVKLVALVAVPPAVVTAIVPLLAPVGTVAVICVSESTVKVAAAPLKVTAVESARKLPVRVTVLPTGPEVGVKPAMPGAPQAEPHVVLPAHVAVPEHVALHVVLHVGPPAHVAVPEQVVPHVALPAHVEAHVALPAHVEAHVVVPTHV